MWGFQRTTLLSSISSERNRSNVCEEISLVVLTPESRRYLQLSGYHISKAFCGCCPEPFVYTIIAQS